MDDDPGGHSAFDDLRRALGDAYYDELGDLPAPTHWPSVPAADAAAQWGELRSWVEALQGRFAHLDHHVIPPCWWRHNEAVEALGALRDHERSSFSATAPATAPLEWLRAHRDVGALLRAWSAEAGCGASHRDPPAPLCSRDIPGWERHVDHDVARRHEREVAQGARGAKG